MINHLQQIRDTVSGERAFSNVREISNFHRIQASTGYREAARFCMTQLKAEGFDSRIRSYKADGHTWYLTSKSFLEWHCSQGYCDLVSPEHKRLADFKADNISIIQRSYPCDYRHQPLDVVMLDKGSEENAYEGLDLKGKIIFTREHFAPFVDWAVKKRGAVGIITDFMREVEGVRNRYDLMDHKNYTSFWWKHTGDEPKTFGYVLSPRAGDELAALCRKMAAENKYPQVTCYMDSCLYEGEIEAVETVLKGETDEEILVIAHLCHPRSSANDNASGVAASMELLRVLRDLTTTGKLPPLRRSIRVCFIPEFTGTFAYLADKSIDWSKVKAGINLDMVGGRQDKGYGPIIISGLPHSTPSFIVDIAALALDEVKKEVPSHNKDLYISMFNSKVSEFETGSDHYILSDPAVNIPTFMLGQWPDINYHSSADVAEQVDPYILHKSTSIAAGYAYTLANLSVDDLPLVMLKGRELMGGELDKLVKTAYAGNMDINLLFARIKHFTDFYIKSCEDFKRFFCGEALERATVLIKKEIQYREKLSDSLFGHYLELCGINHFVYESPKKDDRYDYVPIRKFDAPIVHLDDYALDDEAFLEAYTKYTKADAPKLVNANLVEALVQYYMDGIRSLNEIAEEIHLETGDGDIETIHAFVQLLTRLGLVEAQTQ